MSMHLVWFKRDLRTFDHAPLANAVKAGPAAALYVAEPEYWALPDTSARQWHFGVAPRPLGLEPLVFPAFPCRSRHALWVSTRHHIFTIFKL